MRGDVMKNQQLYSQEYEGIVLCLEESEQYYKALFEYNPDPVYLLDVDGKFLSANANFEKISGYSLEELLQLSFTSLLVEEDLDRTLKYFQRASDGDIHNYEVTLTHRNGQRIYLDVTNIPIIVNDDLISVIGIAKDITEYKRMKDRLEYISYYDPLTHLPNRKLFNEYVTEALTGSPTENQIAVLLLDLDRFKNINDTLNHDIGDLLLQEVAKRLTSCLDVEDIVSRVGGDEFTILLRNISEKHKVRNVVQRILDSFTLPFMLEGYELFITPSIGISLYPAGGRDVETLIKNADTAMYHAKAQGRNIYQVYTAIMNEKFYEKLSLENSLRKALDREEFIIHYQPKVDIRSGKITGMEALVRWQNEKQGRLVSPAEFIPLAEDTGLIVPIGKWILYKACLQNKAWQDLGFPPMTVAVNLSARQFQQQNLIDTVARVLKETGMDPKYLELEITESIAMHNVDSTIAKLQGLKKLGVQISIDDFGTGYSSLSYLQRFPIDTLKIDQSFIREIKHDSNDAAIVLAVIAMAHSLKLKVIAEGVETADQMNYLKSSGCDLMQGYLFSRPIPVEEFEKMLVATTL
jgi:diguanylate cyclase (GGDEF)-like protein/PAS domain S-box-containing protein